MDSLFLLQFACFIFMLLNAAIVAVSHLHVKWESKRYERSRWMIVAAMLGLAIQYMMQMFFGFRAADDGLGAVINILVYTPCFSLISMGIYNLEAPRISCRKMNRVCGGIYAVILLVFCVSIYLHQSLFIREGLYLMLALFGGSVVYCISMIITACFGHSLPVQWALCAQSLVSRCPGFVLSMPRLCSLSAHTLFTECSGFGRA